MSQAKRRRERLSRVSEAFGEMLYENICLHWLPSSAPIACARSEANRARAAANGSGMIIRNSHENASWLGEPCSRRMNRHRNARCTQRNPPCRRGSASAQARKHRDHQHLENVVPRMPLLLSGNSGAVHNCCIYMHLIYMRIVSKEIMDNYNVASAIDTECPRRRNRMHI